MTVPVRKLTVPDRKLAIIIAVSVAVLGMLIGAGIRHETSGGSAFQLRKPVPTTIRALGRVSVPEERTYVGGWCLAPCDTYSVQGTLESVRRGTWYPYYGYVVVVRDGGETIAGRMQVKPLARLGARVTVSGVLFFPTPLGRDGGNLPNGGELSPILEIR